MNYFVTAIDTASGKTLVSAILCEALKADYWKPVQAGLPLDSATVKDLVPNTRTFIHPEKHFLNTPASPHASAKLDNVTILLESIKLPSTTNTIIIEGAGGCLVPINDNEFVIDIAVKLKCELVVVSDLYLGSINHTLLTATEIKRRDLTVKGIIFNGPSNPESQEIILKHTGWKILLHIAREAEITDQVVSRYAEQLLTNWND